MSRLPDLTPESMTDEQKTVADLITSGPHGKVMGPYPAWLHSPELAVRNFAMPKVLLSDHLPLICDFTLNGSTP